MTAHAHHEIPMKGMIAALGAFFMFAVMNAFAKLLAAEDYSVFEIGFFRNLVGLMPFLIYAIVKGREHIKVEKTGAVIIRGVAGTVSLLVTFSAFIAMPMADVTAFLFTTSLILPVLSFFILKEHVGIYRWMAIVIGFIGVIIMIQPHGNVNVLGVSLALTAALMHAGMGVLLRYLGRTETPVASTFYFMLVGTITTALCLPFVGKMPAAEHLWMIIGVGLSGAAAQMCLATAFKNAQAAVVTVFNYSGLIWATLLGWMIWQEWPGTSIWTGGAIVIACNLFILWREQQLARKTATATPV